jgi:hypothetical protein
MECQAPRVGVTQRLDVNPMDIGIQTLLVCSVTLTSTRVRLDAAPVSLQTRTTCDYLECFTPKGFLDSATASSSLVALQEVAMAVEAFIHFEKSTPSMADVKGDSTDPAFKSYLALKDFSFSVENKAAIGSPTSGIQGVYDQEEHGWYFTILVQELCGRWPLQTRDPGPPQDRW